MKLTAKFAFIFSTLCVVVLATTMGLLYYSERRHLLEQVETAQNTALEKLARVCSDSIVEDNDLSRLTYLKTFLTSAPPGMIAHVVLLDTGGRVLLHSDFLRGDFSRSGKEFDSPELKQATTRKGVTRLRVASGSRSLRTVAMPVMVQERRVGTVAIAYDGEVVDRSVTEVQRGSLVRFGQAALAGLVLSLLFAGFLARTLTRPIRDLGVGADKIGEGDLKHRIPADRVDELGDLARKFNTMGERLAELDKLKDSFLAKISHDLRNPLGAIIGYVELMQLGVQGPLTKKQANSLDIISKNGNHLTDLVNNILDLTKLEAGRMEFKRTETNLRQCAEAAIDLMRVKADEYKISLSASGVPKDATVWADEQALNRVLLNLVSNALKFTPEKGKVSIEWSETDAGEDRISVRDTGIGIPADKIERLFQKFSQVAETKDKVREAKGTGLGLAICKEIAEAHGGRIWVESQSNKGTVFHIALPRKPAAAAAPKEAEDER